ncbi:hypothetical protein GE21DRAFT_794 [Neurospora crassa]|uniref:Uncharacterized protein n=2 Tax=Neurospora crassa TaxID=5141 RepID=Q7SG13_NEUCR|nr:hypothetical protein NCU02607 [Neurospora crassa OR74A]EAA35774.1 hypothetical protein NCU02607 [Neurospora crassa OR74A]KHE90046.1 hypothetical protein GE21DRAFT_794 [Neurospora crassa]CAE76457.1 hypothetical protein [Neurospora crassa]|eukprot:XP_965010.1 hypothetical protein NCU02607 [Neurospora crassa OR74A]
MALPEETLKLSPIASDQRSSAPCFSDANYRREDHAQTVAGRAKHQVDLMISHSRRSIEKQGQEEDPEQRDTSNDGFLKKSETSWVWGPPPATPVLSRPHPSFSQVPRHVALGGNNVHRVTGTGQTVPRFL